MEPSSGWSRCSRPGIAANPPTHRRVLITSDDGTCQGYERIADGVLFCGALVTPNAAKAAADAAAATAAAADASKAQAALTTILANVARVNASGAGSGTDANRDNWLMAITYVVSRRS
jgi:heterodisulfide reductase subunit A-like polyferredoxin